MTPPATACYTYDGTGLRFAKAVTGCTTTVYIFSGSAVIGGWQTLREETGVGCRIFSVSQEKVRAFHCRSVWNRPSRGSAMAHC